LYIAIYGVKRHLPGGVARVPVPNFSGTPLSGFTPLTVQFTDASYRFPTSWDWDFGDSTPHGTVQNPIHQYSHAERYNVTLTVRNGAGFDILSRQGYVTVNGSEQLPTYTEVDPGNNLTVTPNSVSANNLPRNVDAYLYKDFGAGHFNGFEIEFDAVCYSTSDTGGFLVPIMLSNKLDDFPHQAADAVSVAFYKYTTDAYRISLMRGPESAGVHYMTHTDTHRWFKLRRSAGSDTVYLTIYSDIGRTTEITTLSLGGFGTATYRYILAAVSYNSGHAYKINGVVRFPNVLSP